MRLTRPARFLVLLVFGLLSALLVVGAAAASGGTTIAAAPLIQSGAQETGNTAADSTTEGSEGIGQSSGCWNDLEYWRLPLVVGDSVLISGGAVSPGANFEIAVFPPGTTNANIANASAVEDGLPLSRSLHFTADATGTYPLVAGPNCYDGTDGPFSFRVTVTHSTGGLGAVVTLPPLRQIADAGAVAANVRTSSGASITDPQLVLRLYGSWKETPSALAKAHLLATASPKDGSARFEFHLPAGLNGVTVELHVAGTGSGYRPVSSAVLKVTVS